MQDYEQLYYDALYKIKQLENQNKMLEEQNNIYISLLKNGDLKRIIVDSITKYINKKGIKK